MSTWIYFPPNPLWAYFWTSKDPKPKYFLNNFCIFMAFPPGDIPPPPPCLIHILQGENRPIPRAPSIGLSLAMYRLLETKWRPTLFPQCKTLNFKCTFSSGWSENVQLPVDLDKVRGIINQHVFNEYMSTWMKACRVALHLAGACSCKLKREDHTLRISWKCVAVGKE